MNQITNPPNVYDFGHEFNYEVWTADTKITLTNVPWANDYKDVFRPNSQADLNTYIDARLTTNVNITSASYAPINRPISINIPLNTAMQFNYVRVQNPRQPVLPGDTVRDYYYFILGMDFVAPNTTNIVVELDLFQTFGYEIELGTTYIERGHLPMAAENRFSRYGVDYLTQPEGLDLGNSYKTYRGAFMANTFIDCVIASTISLTTPPIHPGGEPRQESAAGSAPVQGRVYPAEIYALDGNSYYFNSMKQFSYITRGIYSAILVPELREFQRTASDGLQYVASTPLPAPMQHITYPPQRTLKTLMNGFERSETVITKWRDALRAALPARVRHIDKLLTSPYLQVEISDADGAPIYWKPELINSEDLNLKQYLSVIPGSERLVTTNPNYSKFGVYLDDLEFEASLTFTNFPRVPIVNDGANIASASNYNTRQAARSAADWSYQRTMAANEMAYKNSGIAVGLSGELAGIGRGSDSQQTALTNQTMMQQQNLNAIGGIATSTGLGMIGGPAGAAAGLASGAASAITGGISNNISMQSNIDSLAIRNNASLASQGASTAASNQISSNNRNLANSAARGDYQASIAMMNAQARDTELTPPQVGAQSGGAFLNVITNRTYIKISFKLPHIGDLMRIGNYFMRYGYAHNRYQKPPKDLHVMSKFTYWKMSEVYITRGNMPELYRQAFRGIMEKGVTVWKDANDIGNVDMASNQPLPGIRIEDQ